MPGADKPPAGAAADGVRLVADALGSAVFGLAEALGSPPAGDGKPARATPAAPAVSAEPAGSGGVVRSLASLPSRAAADAAGAIAASVVPAVIERIDVNALLAKVDVNALVKRVDLGAVVESIDPNPLLEKVDVDQLVQRVDVGALAQEALDSVDIGDVIQESTAGLGTEALEAVRVQAMRADDLLAHIVDRVLLRRRPRDTAVGRLWAQQ